MKTPRNSKNLKTFPKTPKRTQKIILKYLWKKYTITIWTFSEFRWGLIWLFSWNLVFFFGTSWNEGDLDWCEGECDGESKRRKKWVNLQASVAATAKKIINKFIYYGFFSFFLDFFHLIHFWSFYGWWNVFGYTCFCEGYGLHTEREWFDSHVKIIYIGTCCRRDNILSKLNWIILGKINI